MTELVQLISQKTGLPQDKAQQVVDTVVAHLKEKLPGSVAGDLDSFLGGGAEAGDQGLMDKAKSVISGLGGLMGNKSE